MHAIAKLDQSNLLLRNTLQVLVILSSLMVLFTVIAPLLGFMSALSVLGGNYGTGWTRTMAWIFYWLIIFDPYVLLLGALCSLPLAFLFREREAKYTLLALSGVLALFAVAAWKLMK